jgi:predicted RNA-binding Zn-ribbon protein involved in translation (DUF1610 family)
LLSDPVQPSTSFARRGSRVNGGSTRQRVAGNHERFLGAPAASRSWGQVLGTNDGWLGLNGSSARVHYTRNRRENGDIAQSFVFSVGKELMATSKRQPAAKKRASSKRTAAQTAARASAEFVCPECGRTFTRAAALGAHRSRAHGVAGRSTRAANRRASSARAASAKRGSATRTPSAAAAQPRSAAKTRTGAATRVRTLRRRNGIDRDALLKTLFPDGMPPREEVIRAASGWLDDAERLSRMR